MDSCSFQPLSDEVDIIDQVNRGLGSSRTAESRRTGKILESGGNLKADGLFGVWFHEFNETASLLKLERR